MPPPKSAAKSNTRFREAGTKVTQQANKAAAAKMRREEKKAKEAKDAKEAKEAKRQENREQERRERGWGTEDDDEGWDDEDDYAMATPEGRSSGKGRTVGWKPEKWGGHPAMRGFCGFVFGFGIPFFFFLGYFIKHKMMDDAALDVGGEKGKDGSRDEEDREEARDELDWIKTMWQKYSVRQRLLMIMLSFLLWIVGDKFAIYWKIWYRLWAFIMAITAFISILVDTGRGNAYIYFRDNVWPQSDAPLEEMKQTCIEFGCGYHPHEKVQKHECSEATKGKDVTKYS